MRNKVEKFPTVEALNEFLLQFEFPHGDLNPVKEIQRGNAKEWWVWYIDEFEKKDGSVPMG